MSVLSSLRGLVGRDSPVVGIDIGHNSVKAVELQKVGKAFRLSRAAVEAIPAGAEGESDEQGIVKAIARLAQSWSFPAKNGVVSAVSGEAVIVRPIPVPVLSEKQNLDLAVESEVRDFIPFDPTDVVIDYQKLGNVQNDGAKAQEVLVVAARRELIEQHLSVLERAGIVPAIIDAGAIALVNAMIVGCETGEDETVGLVNIGSDITNIAIVRKDTTRFTRDLPIAGRNITRSIMSELDKDFAEGERLKRMYGLGATLPSEGGEPDASQGGESIIGDIYKAIDALEEEKQGQSLDLEDESASVATICEQVMADICSEVKRSLLYYENQMDGEPTSRILLAGGSALLPGAVEFFQNNLETPVDIMQPFERIGSGYGTDEQKTMGAMLATGIGLALRCAA